jgi:hypothetical protein
MQQWIRNYWMIPRHTERIIEWWQWILDRIIRAFIVINLVEHKTSSIVICNRSANFAQSFVQPANECTLQETKRCISRPVRSWCHVRSRDVIGMMTFRNLPDISWGITRVGIVIIVIRLYLFGTGRDTYKPHVRIGWSTASIVRSVCLSKNIKCIYGVIFWTGHII